MTSTKARGARHPLSDNARAYWSTLIAGAVSVVAMAALVLTEQVSDLTWGRLLIVSYLVVWPVYVGTYLVWTHRSYARRSPAALRAAAQRELRTLRTRWARLFGSGDASNATLSGAVVAVAVTIAVAQTPEFRTNSLFVLLGLLCVSASWALMVYSFALQYLRLAAGGTSPDQHLDLGLDEEGRFGDYLTLAVLLSTMAATVSATIRTRRAWSTVRTNVLCAFVFNSVIVAMMVSLLFGGLGG